MTPPQKYPLIPDPEFGNRIPHEIYLLGWQRAEALGRLVRAEFLCDGLPRTQAECLFTEALYRIERYSRKFPGYQARIADFKRCRDPHEAENVFNHGVCDGVGAERDKMLENPTYEGPSSDECAFGWDSWDLPPPCDCGEDSAK